MHHEMDVQNILLQWPMGSRWVIVVYFSNISSTSAFVHFVLKRVWWWKSFLEVPHLIFMLKQISRIEKVTQKRLTYAKSIYFESIVLLSARHMNKMREIIRCALKRPYTKSLAAVNAERIDARQLRICSGNTKTNERKFVWTKRK